LTGTDFWNLFLGAAIPNTELQALGEDIGYMRESTSPAASSALLKLGYAMTRMGAKSTSTQLFDALKAEMPAIFSRSELLNTLAHSYNARAPYANLDPAVREYVDAVAKQLPAPGPQPMTSLTQPVTAPSTSAAPSTPPTSAASAAPKGLTQKEWDFLRAIVGKLSAGQGKSVNANNLASARNLAERGNLAIVEALDAEIESRGDGAQDPNSLSRGEPARAGIGALGIVGLLLAFFFFFK